MQTKYARSSLRTQRCCNVFITSITLRRRRMNVKTTFLAYWVNVKLHFSSHKRGPLSEGWYFYRRNRIITSLDDWRNTQRHFRSDERQKPVGTRDQSNESWISLQRKKKATGECSRWLFHILYNKSWSRACDSFYCAGMKILGNKFFLVSSPWSGNRPFKDRTERI